MTMSFRIACLCSISEFGSSFTCMTTAWAKFVHLRWIQTSSKCDCSNTFSKHQTDTFADATFSPGLSETPSSPKFVSALDNVAELLERSDTRNKGLRPNCLTPNV